MKITKTLERDSYIMNHANPPGVKKIRILHAVGELRINLMQLDKDGKACRYEVEVSFNVPSWRS